MRIVHVSDTHLGFSAFSKVDEASGLNLREIDFYRAFEEFVDLALKARPDLVLHTGDLFDSVRPSNRALTLAVEQLLRFSEAEIPVVLIAGNHSTPKLRETGSVFRLFEHLKGIYPIYKGEYERLDIGEATVHALPHCEPETMIKELVKFAPTKKKYNLGMLHAGVSSLRMFRMGEFNESIVPSSMLRTDLDYFALGHYHNYCDVTKNAFYSGSTERLSFAEAGESKGFVLVDLRGHGASQGFAPPHTLDAAAADLAALVPKSDPDAPPAPPWDVALRRLALHDYTVRMDDRAVGRPARYGLTKTDLVLEGLSTAKGSKGALSVIRIPLMKQVMLHFQLMNPSHATCDYSIECGEVQRRNSIATDNICRRIQAVRL